MNKSYWSDPEKWRERARARYRAFKEEYNERSRMYYKSHKDEQREKARARWWKNREKRLAAQKEWRSSDPLKKEREAKKRKNPKRKAWFAERRIRKRTSVPVWADIKASRRVYIECAKMNKESGFVKFHVDHVVPLQGKNVCGLHVANNLRIVPAEFNIAKGNKTPQLAA